MSKIGRCVADHANEAWYTYGDGYLFTSSEGAKRVVATAATSMLDFLRAFVLGEIEASGWQSVWAKMPAYFNEHVTSVSECIPGHGWPALRSVSRPAQAVMTTEAFLFFDGSIAPAKPRGVMLGRSYDMGGLRFGYRTIRSRAFAAIGTSVKQSGTRPRAYLADLGYVFQIATTNRGVLTHEIGFGELIYYRPHNDEWFSHRDVSFRILYAVNVEMGRLYLRVQAGHAFSGPWGPNVSAGFGWVRASAK
jgi:hypothetical protein